MTKSAPAKRPAKNKLTKSRTVAGCMFIFPIYRTMRYIVITIQSIYDISHCVKGVLGVVYFPSLPFKRSYKRLAMGVCDSTCCAVFLKRATSFSGIAFWLKGILFSAILLL